MEADRIVEAVTCTERWPGRIRALAARWRQPADARQREADLAEMWRLLNLALHRALRSQAGLHGRLDASEVVDIAADKAVDLLGQLDTGRWQPEACPEAQVAGYLVTVARNGLVDRLRRRRLEAASAAASIETTTLGRRGGREEGFDPDLAEDGRRYARALVECAAALTERARRAWFLRVFCDFTAPEIAAHPEIRTSTGGADLMLHRSRRRIRKCLESKGFPVAGMPPGTFTALWEMIESRRGARVVSREGEA